MILSAPTIDVRARIPEKTIRELISRIGSAFNPQKIVLFGSYAYGIPRPESDIDLLVVMDTPLRESDQAIKIRQVINPQFGVDILVYTPERLAQRIELGDSFLREITEKGVIVYESHHA